LFGASYLGVHRADRAGHPVRLVELCLDGKWWSYLTNVLDPQKLTAEQVWRLYVERWTIEQVFTVARLAEAGRANPGKNAGPEA
jgi:hypothetical protein